MQMALTPSYLWIHKRKKSREVFLSPGMMTCHPTKESYTQEFKRGTERESVVTSHISCPPYFPSISGGYQDTPLQRQSLLFLAKLRKKGTTRTLFIGVKLHSKWKVLYSRKLSCFVLIYENHNNWRWRHKRIKIKCHAIYYATCLFMRLFGMVMVSSDKKSTPSNPA